MKYDITYHMAQGISCTVGGVDVEQYEKIKKGLSNPNGVIDISSHTTNKIQLIPVRSILIIEFIERKK